MTKNNEQIIIDGVDVSKCEFYSGGLCNIPDSIETFDSCMDKNPNCYYKQLKRKEQECEKLRFPMKDNNYAILTKEEFENFDQLKKENDELKKQNNQFDIGINEQFSKIIELEGKNNLLNAENSELKGIRDRNFLHALEEQKKANKLKQTLAEIKEICKSVCGNGLDEEVDKFGDILEKINEVIDV